MSPKKALILIFVLIVVVGSFVAFNKTNAPTIDDTAKVPQGAWIEVVNPSVFSLGNSKELLKKELHSGDIILPGTVVETDKNSTANIHLPDGSLLRLDKDTTITLSESYFDKSSGKVVVRVELALGRVWSKVFSLATPDSVWEVKTSNAVATVRGTAFSVSFKNGKSSFLGSQHKIAVSPIDPKTKKKIEGVEVEVGEKKLIEINDTDVKKAGLSSKVLEQKLIDAPKEIVEDKFVKESEEEDSHIDLFVGELEKSGKEKEEVRGKKIEEDNSKFRDLKKEDEAKDEVEKSNKEDSKVNVEKEDSKTESKDEVEKSDTSKTNDKSAVSTSGGASLENTSEGKLLITSSRSLKQLTEQDRTTLTATLVMPDGSKKDVTEKCLWRLVGGIGRFEKPGVFYPELESSIAEEGEGYGAIVVSYSENGKVMAIGKTDIINVKMKIDDTPVDISNQ